MLFPYLRRSGRTFMVFSWPAFWWLDCYGDLQRHLGTGYCRVLQNDRVVVFDLRR